jgi:putative peptidoglycan lipid II flippase
VIGYQEPMSLFRAAATVGGFTMVSRVLGFVRDVLIAGALGAGPVADAFFFAFRLPNFFRRLFAEGAFNAAFVPQFARRFGDRNLARVFAEDVLAVLLAALLVFLLAAEIAMPWVLRVIVKGWVGQPQFPLTVEFARITFPYLLFISLVSLLGGVLNSLDRFAAVAVAPSLLNLCMIAALLWFAALSPTPGHALAWAVAISGILQFLLLAAECARAGMPLRLPWPRFTPEVRRVLTLMIPAAIGSGVAQINLLIDAVIASFLPPGSVSYLYYADHIYELPLAVIGIAIGTAILPLLARQLRAGEQDEAVATLNRAVGFGMLLTLPAAAALTVLAEPIIAVLFERGAFGPTETRATAAALAAYAFGLPAFVLVKILSPGFFAREDTATPVRIALVCIVINIAVALALMGPLLHVGLATATVVSSWVNALALGWLLQRRGAFQPTVELRDRLIRMVLASAAMAAVLVVLMMVLRPWFTAALMWRGLALALLVAAGMAAYLGFALALRATDPRELRRLLTRRG